MRWEEKITWYKMLGPFAVDGGGPLIWVSGLGIWSLGQCYLERIMKETTDERIQVDVIEGGRSIPIHGLLERYI